MAAAALLISIGRLPFLADTLDNADLLQTQPLAVYKQTATGPLDTQMKCYCDILTSYLPMLFKKAYMLTDPIGFLKNHLPKPEELEW